MVRFPSDWKRNDSDSGGDGGGPFGAFCVCSRIGEQAGGALMTGRLRSARPLKGTPLNVGALTPHLCAGLASVVAARLIKKAKAMGQELGA